MSRKFLSCDNLTRDNFEATKQQNLRKSARISSFYGKYFGKKPKRDKERLREGFVVPFKHL